MLMFRQAPLSDDLELTDDYSQTEWNSTPRSSQAGTANEPYLPSPEEIEEHCRQIRRDWSENEHRKRAGHSFQPLEIATTPCRISFSDLFYLDNS